MRVLFIGDIFGAKAVGALQKHLGRLRSKHRADFVIAQGENVSGRKGLVKADYLSLKKAGVDAFTMGNHIWAKPEISDIINNDDLIRPLNVSSTYAGQGSRLFKVKGETLRVTSMLGIGFNKLGKPWKQEKANNFFDAFDKLENNSDHFHIIDFHAETTSEKNVFALYLDGKVNALIGTHTHVQTNDARILPLGSAFITDAGMTGPINSAIGADFDAVYQKMRFDSRVRFEASTNTVAFNGVLLKMTARGNKIKTINHLLSD